MAISTAWLTSSGRASISSWAMNDAHRHRHDADRRDVELLDQRGGVADHLLGGEAVGVLGGADAAVVERDGAVAGRRNAGT